MSKEKIQTKSMRTFYIIWFGQLISTLGSGLTGFALGVWIYQETNSVFLFTTNMFVYAGTSVLITPFAGALVDRWNRRWVMILSDAGAGLSTLAVWLLFTSGQMEYWHIYVLGAFNAAFTAFQFPAHSAATTMIVPKDLLGRAGGMVQISEAISMLASPVIAGALYVSVGLGTITLIDFATFLVAVFTLLVVFIPEPERSEESEAAQGSLLKEVAFGWRYIVQRKGLFYYMLYISALNFVFGMFNPLLTPLLLELGDAQQMGIVFSVFGVGMLVGTLVMSIWGGPKKRRMFAILPSAIWTGLSMLALGAKPSLVLVAVSGFLIMFALPIFNGNSSAMWQTKVAPDVQGRVFSVRRLIGQFTYPFSILLVGPLVENVFQPLMDEGGALASSVGRVIGVGPGRGTALTFIVLGLIYLLSTITAFSHPRIRRLELEIPDAAVKVREDRSTSVEEAVSVPAD